MKKKKRPGKRQRFIEGTEPPSIEEIEQAMHVVYLRAKARKAAQSREDTARAELKELLVKHKKDLTNGSGEIVYRYRDNDPPLTAKITLTEKLEVGKDTSPDG